MVTWAGLAALTRTITKANPEGVNKSSSGMLTVTFGNDAMFTDNSESITVEINGYDIIDWSRHTYFGPFSSEDEAKQAVLYALMKAYSVVDEERKSENLPEIDIPKLILNLKKI